MRALLPKDMLSRTYKSIMTGEISPITFCSYRVECWKSTRTLFASILTVCIMLSAALSFAENFSRADANELPRGALESSSSLYLREAASSPIRWQRWSPETFALARKLNRPMLIDIGAVWCHWCHVMDQTTYADPEVVATLNSSFVPVKVDSDQRPDVDGYYQNAATHLTGVAGWPLTCFATSGGALFFAAGYLPPRPGTGPNRSGGETSSMAPLLRRISEVYGHDRAALEQQAEVTAAKLKLSARANAPPAKGLEAMRAQILAGLASSYDRESGGFSGGDGPRFYDFPAIRLALAHGFFSHPEFTRMALESLKKISAGGVFDQIGGGFHRYSTDSRWGVPHFEKMSYDNAMALQAYVEVYQATGDQEFAEVARAIVGYVNREMLDPATHAFYSHQDADSFRGDDGSFYTWTVEEVRHLLPADEARASIIYFGMYDSPARAPDGRIVLRRAIDENQLASRLKVSTEAARVTLAKARTAMLAAREKRKIPQIDHAVLTDRNALMAGAYLSAYAALGDDSLRQIALANLDFILAHLRASDGSVLHVWSDGRAQVSGLAADQVYLLEALVSAAQSSDDAKYPAQARALASVILAKFRSPISGLIVNRDNKENGLAFADSDTDARVFFDTPTPSVQGVAAIAFAKLALLTGDQDYTRAANALLASAPANASSMMSNTLATVGLALEYQHYGYAEVAVVDASSDRAGDDLRRSAFATYRPGKIVRRISGREDAATLPPSARAMLAASTNRDVSLAFLCSNTACATPTDNPSELAEMIKSFGVESGKASLASGKPDAPSPPM
ncbi:MAG: hypothetical protein JWM69_1283 [Candidatus Binatus sp.]|nr:hypothetical protein [Candidatus Binatus sp.]